MINSIADQVDDRVGELVNHLPVEFDFGSIDNAFHLLADRAGEFAYQARRRFKDNGQRQHAHQQHLVVQFVHQHFLRLHIFLKHPGKAAQGHSDLSGERFAAHFSHFAFDAVDLRQSLAQAGVT